jgi:hypothetical protein
MKDIVIYKAEGIVSLHSGVVAVTADQAKRRRQSLSPIKGQVEIIKDDDGNKSFGEGLYAVTSQVQFKAGEVFGYDGSIPKMYVNEVSEATEEVIEESKVEKDERTKEQKVFDVFDDWNEKGLLDTENEDSKAYLTANGIPDASVLSETVGENVSSNERNDFWNKWLESEESEED